MIGRGFDPEREARRAVLRGVAGFVGAVCVLAGIGGLAVWLNDALGPWAGPALWLATGGALLAFAARGGRS